MSAAAEIGLQNAFEVRFKRLKNQYQDHLCLSNEAEGRDKLRMVGKEMKSKT